MFYEGCTLDEIRAFRELENETFDFGEGKMKIEGWFGSEDAYYRMCLNEENDEIIYNKSYKKTNKKKKVRLNKYARKQIDKQKLDKLKNKAWWAVQDKGYYKIRCYLSNARKIAKKNTYNKIRKYTGYIGNGSNYKKFYDYWWKIF